MTSVLIKGGRLIDPAQKLDGLYDLCLEDGLVKAVQEPGTFPSDQVTASQGLEIIDATGQWVVPGLIDLHVHLREPGQEYKETVASGTRTAAAGGFTAVVAMPNTSPSLDTAEAIAALLAKACEVASTRVWPAAAMTKKRSGQELTAYDELKDAGAVAVTDDGTWLTHPKVLRRVLDYAAVTGLLPMSHAEDLELAHGGVMHEGAVATRLGLPGIPAQAEINAVTRDINMVELTGRPLHFCHLSTKGAVEALRLAKAKGLPVSGETAPHYFKLNHEAVGDYNTNAKMNPPLRTEEDRLAICHALADGTLDAIATDHAPHSVLEKELEFCDAAMGIIGLDTALPLTLELVRQKVITPTRLVELLSTNPARLLKVVGGDLAPGQVADVTVIDPEANFTYQPQDFFSLSANSPFCGWSLTGRAVCTIVGGRIVHRC